MTSENRPGTSEQNARSRSKQNGRVHHVEELRRKGIQKVRVVGQSQLQELAREAVARAVLELAESLEVSEETKKSLVGRAQETILKESREELPEIIDEPAMKPDVQLKTPSTDAESTAVSLPMALQDQEMLKELSRLIARDWRSELNSVQDSHRAQVERLEMRIKELTRALRATHQVLTRGKEEKGTEDLVLMPFDHKKEELLDQLFQANVALREISSGLDSEDGTSMDGEGRSA